jgi:tetratricopeptide (TPR) repeat protein/SAM-dependent methyltransferase
MKQSKRGMGDKRSGPHPRSDQAAPLFAAALQHHQRGELQQADELYRRLLSLQGDHFDALHYLGVLRHQVGQNDIAVELMGKALAVNERSPECHFNIALAFAALSKWDEAVSHNRRAVALRPDYPVAYLNLGNALKAQGKAEDAAASYRRALASQPANHVLHCNLANVLSELNRADDAIAHYRRALALKPDYAEACNNLGTVLMAQGRIDEARELHRRALAINPELAEAAVNLGNSFKSEGKLDDAIGWYRQALAARPNSADAHNNLGAAHAAREQWGEAAAAYRKAVELNRRSAAARRNLGAALLALGEAAEALQIVTQAHALEPSADAKALFVACFKDPRCWAHVGTCRDQLVAALSEPWENPRDLVSAGISALLADPAIGACVARAAHAWPSLLSAEALYGPLGPAAIAEDHLLRTVLETVQVNNIAFEQFLTSARAVLLADATQASDAVEDDRLRFACALARQCFINEYVFGCSAEEAAQAGELRQEVTGAMASDAPVAALKIAALAAYGPLAELPDADALAQRDWAAPVAVLIDQQVREPRREAELRASMPRLTTIDDAVSLMVREQYEQNPYPRWGRSGAAGTPQSLDATLARRFPLASFRRLGERELDYLVAGCGTGQQVALIKQSVSGIRLLAVDLSLASLAYAKRMSEAMGLSDVAFAQADILKLGTIGRTFDVVDSTGVLLTLADPWAGWRILLSLLRPGGVMRIGLYSALAHADIAAAHRMIAERGFGGSPEDIRRCRQEIIALDDGAPAKGVTKLIDFFSLSDCRDALFHVHEHRMRLPEIARFLGENDLDFIGFELGDDVHRRYSARFPDDPARINLDHWHQFEQENPRTFAGMYLFWLQKRGGAAASAAPA